MRFQALIIAIVALVSVPAHAWELRARFVRRVGAVDTPLPGVLALAPGQSATLRLQFGVFDDDNGPAPDGGFVGWNVGTLNGGGSNASGAARLNPFNFAPAPGFAGTQAPLDLFNIDNTLGTQTLFWKPPGTPPPPPVIRGRNTFVSVFQLVTIAGSAHYDITAAGNAIVATEWRVIFESPGEPPELPPGVVYVPLTLPPMPFALTLSVLVPAPSAAAVPELLIFVCRRRRPRV